MRWERCIHGSRLHSSLARLPTKYYLPTAFCSTRAGGEARNWRDAFRPDTLGWPHKAAVKPLAPHGRGATRSREAGEHGERG